MSQLVGLLKGRIHLPVNGAITFLRRVERSSKKTWEAKFAPSPPERNMNQLASWRNEGASSAPVTLRAGRSSATFVYDGNASRWILVSYN